MSAEDFFKRIKHRQPSKAEGDAQPQEDTLAVLLHRRVAEPFARFSGLSVVAVPLDGPDLGDADEPPDNPGHPACGEFAGTDFCRESWLLHLAEMRHRPEAQWHKCEYGRLCGLVPVVWRNRCLAGLKLACPDSVGEDVFERNVELLDILVENLVVAEADTLAQICAGERASEDVEEPAPGRAEEAEAERPSHPQVLRALEYIEAHLSEPKLNVGYVAGRLDMNPDYLAHLFAEQTGQRMSRHIATQRVELAKTLLATTNWQIKRIARETGHANPNWFSHVFRVHTGLTPSAYRRQNRVR